MIEDVNTALKNAENALRDFIGAILEKNLGADWIEKCGVTPERIAAWKQRKLEEEAKQKFGTIEPRLLYYADFYDLRNILNKHWHLFSEALGEKRVFDVFLGELERFRNPDAHRRELLPHQKHLAFGIEGEIRTRIVRYRSKMETAADYFPAFESVRDSLGNVYAPGPFDLKTVCCKQVLRPGDKLEFVLTAKDPQGEDLLYALSREPLNLDWQISNGFSTTIEINDVGKNRAFTCWLKSKRPVHAHEWWDDSIMFLYDVLPARPTSAPVNTPESVVK